MPPRSSESSSPGSRGPVAPFFGGIEPEGALVRLQARAFPLVGELGQPIKRALDVRAAKAGNFEVPAMSARSALAGSSSNM